MMTNMKMQLALRDQQMIEKRRAYEQCLLSFWGSNLDEEGLKALHMACQRARAEYMEAMRARDIAERSLPSDRTPASHAAAMTRAVVRDGDMAAPS